MFNKTIAFIKKVHIKKIYIHLGFKNSNLLGIFLLSFFLSYSIAFAYQDLVMIFQNYFTEYTEQFNNINTKLKSIYGVFNTYQNIIIGTFILFIFQMIFFQNNYFQFSKNKVIKFIDQTIQKISLLIPIKQFSSYMFINHIDQNNELEVTFYNDFQTAILLVSFILSTLLISVIPSLIKILLKWRKNNNFAINSGLIYHFQNIDDLKMSYDFKQTITNLGQLKNIKILGITGYNTFVNLESYLSNIIKSQHLSSINNPIINILLSERNSEGLKFRALQTGIDVSILNSEIRDTLSFIDNHDVLKDKSIIKYYRINPKYKIIILEGKQSIVLLQAYLDKNNILEEQLFIYEDRIGSSMFKILNEQFDDLFLLN